MDRVILDPFDELELLDEAIEVCRSRIIEQEHASVQIDGTGFAQHEVNLRAALRDQLTRQIQRRDELEALRSQG